MSPKTKSKKSKKTQEEKPYKPAVRKYRKQKRQTTSKWIFDKLKKRKNIRRSAGKGNTISAFEKGVENGEFNSLIIDEEDTTKSEGKVKEKKPSIRRKSQDSYSIKIEAKKEIENATIINNDICKSFKVEYVLEVVAYIILAKNIKNLEIWTPYGKCRMKKISNQNYIAGSGQKYLTLIGELNGETQIINNVSNFLLWKLPQNFEIDISKGNSKIINNINVQLKQFGSKTVNDVAAEMCGVFISEMIRTSGKVIRSAFKKWPESVEDLSSKFVQSNQGGNTEFREYIKNPSSVSEKTREAIKKNVEGFSDSE